MTENNEAVGGSPETVSPPKSLKEKVMAAFSSLNQEFEAIQRAKEAGEKKNIKELKKDWVNRCCG